jgi:hypothetical protein
MSTVTYFWRPTTTFEATHFGTQTLTCERFHTIAAKEDVKKAITSGKHPQAAASEPVILSSRMCSYSDLQSGATTAIITVVTRVTYAA